jgi:hypothetical protein
MSNSQKSDHDNHHFRSAINTPLPIIIALVLVLITVFTVSQMISTERNDPGRTISEFPHVVIGFLPVTDNGYLVFVAPLNQDGIPVMDLKWEFEKTQPTDPNTVYVIPKDLMETRYSLDGMIALDNLKTNGIAILILFGVLYVSRRHQKPTESDPE